MTIVVVVCSHSRLWALGLLDWMCPLKREQATRVVTTR